MSVAKPLPHDAAKLHVTGAARILCAQPCSTYLRGFTFGSSPENP